MERFIRVRAIGEGDAAYSCARPAVLNGSRFYGRDAAGKILPKGERVAWSFHVHELLAQGQLELVKEPAPDAMPTDEPAPSDVAKGAE